MADTGTRFLGLDASTEAVGRLQRVLGERPRGLFSDLDGTLSPIALTPAEAVLLPGVAELLQRARDVFDVVAIVSGRSAADAQHMVGVRGIVYLGNHGLERLEPATDAAASAAGAAGAGGSAEDTLRVLPAAEAYVPAINAALGDVEDALAFRYPGILVERKGVTGSIHVRNTSDPEAAAEAIMRALTVAGVTRGLRVTQGKMVIEVRPPVDVDKGTAIADMIQSRGLRGALYLGDDRTDIDAFRALRGLTDAGVCRCVTVAVLHKEAPADLAAEADMTLERIERVPDFLRWLLASG